ncbi:hypothetical protein [Hyphomicrobium sp. 2TAF46]|uniref:hypothetical protein n=1 Tax=Hyphomicrobium sp. 2TAF46 TaxID=3233019 RepID=UPI003F928BD9
MGKNLRTRPKTGLSRGTPGYAINFFRSDILVNLQLDLKRLERSGIDEEICRVRELLSALVSAASAEPKGSFWGPKLHEVLREYEITYKKWNDVSGSEPHSIAKRDELLCKLQDIRHDISNTCRRNAHSLSEAHDLELISSINDALVQVIRAVPNTFTALSKSAERYAQRAMLGH